MSEMEVIGWGAVGFVLLCLAVLGGIVVWAAIDYIRNNRNVMGGK